MNPKIFKMLSALGDSYPVKYIMEGAHEIAASSAFVTGARTLPIPYYLDKKPDGTVIILDDNSKIIKCFSVDVIDDLVNAGFFGSSEDPVYFCAYLKRIGILPGNAILNDVSLR
jgi:hypothetical protein